MEGYVYSSSYPDSGGSSPRSREVEGDSASGGGWEDAPAPPHVAPVRVKLMCSYGGRIQPRSHDNQLSYVGGETKILAVDRSVRYHAIMARLVAISGCDDIVLKYQLPGEDLDALITVGNDEDLEHMMMEYDRLCRSGSKPVARLRLFLFAGMGRIGGGQDLAVKQAAAVVTPREEAPDYLFGLETEGRDPAAEKVGIEVPVAVPEVETAAKELQRHLLELQRHQIAEKQQQAAAIVLNGGGDETLGKVYSPPAEYYALPPAVQEMPSPVTVTGAPVQAYWQDHQMNPPPPAAPRFASFVGGDGHLYVIPGLFQHNAAPGQPYYATVQRVVQAQAPVAYPPPQQPKSPAMAYDNSGGARPQAALEVSQVTAGYTAPPATVGAYDNGGAAVYAAAAAYDSAVAAYDNAGRAAALYYAGSAAAYQTASNVAIPAESKVLKPSQVS